MLDEFEQRVAGLGDEDDYVLTLFVNGASDLSVRAIRNVRDICEEHLAGRYQLEVVDVHQDVALMRKHNVLAAPTLIREAPLPQRRLVGDLSDSPRVLVALDLMTAGGPAAPGARLVSSSSKRRRLAEGAGTTPQHDAIEQMRLELDLVRDRLADSEEALRAIRYGEVDAVLVADVPGRERVFTLSSADRPYRNFVENMSDGAATVSVGRHRPLLQPGTRRPRGFVVPADRGSAAGRARHRRRAGCGSATASALMARAARSSRRCWDPAASRCRSGSGRPRRCPSTTRT